jgi:hypothetical protein
LLLQRETIAGRSALLGQQQLATIPDGGLRNLCKALQQPG